MKEQLNTNFIIAIQTMLPPQANLANRIMEILEISKEAVYRRLRNEVPFTLNEASVIARTLGISLDQLIGNFESKTAVFNLNLIHFDHALNNYCNTLSRFLEYLECMKGYPNASISTIANSVPYLLYLSCPNIMKFRLCRWLHQTNKFMPGSTMEEIVIPEKIRKLQKEIHQSIQEIANTNMIWDSRIFHSFIKEVNYFQKLNYINNKDVAALKKELSTLLDETEQIASEGCYPNKKRINIYLSNIHFESSYTFLERGTFRVSLLRLYSINSIDTSHPDICNLQKEWISTLKRYSTLITETGQIQRISFFKEQRRKLEELDI